MRIQWTRGEHNVFVVPKHQYWLQHRQEYQTKAYWWVMVCSFPEMWLSTRVDWSFQFALQLLDCYFPLIILKGRVTVKPRVLVPDFSNCIEVQGYCRLSYMFLSQPRSRAACCRAEDKHRGYVVLIKQLNHANIHKWDQTDTLWRVGQ